MVEHCSLCFTKEVMKSGKIIIDIVYPNGASDLSMCVSVQRGFVISHYWLLIGIFIILQG